MSDAWDKGGVKGLVETLTKGKQTWDDLVDLENTRREELSLMSPAEKRAYDKEQEADRKAADADRSKRLVDEQLEKLTQKEYAAEAATLQSDMNTPFSKYRFSGKLGDPIKEQQLDEMLWESTRATLLKLPDEVEITQKVIAKEFARRSKLLEAHIQTKSREGATEVLKQKGREAKEQAQSAMRGATKQSSAEKDLRESISSGNFLSGWKNAMVGNKKRK